MYDKKIMLHFINLNCLYGKGVKILVGGEIPLDDTCRVIFWLPFSISGGEIFKRGYYQDLDGENMYIIHDLSRDTPVYRNWNWDASVDNQLWALYLIRPSQ